MRTACICSGCGQKILWMVTKTGKMMPVDHAPSLDNVDEFNPATMVSHFATCKKAGQFRKKKK
jgi:hypothetical protein